VSTGIDWSEHDNRRHPGLDLAQFFAGFDYVIVRTHNENAGLDAFVGVNVDAAKRCGKPWGLYAWPVTGWGHDGNRQHAASIVRQFGAGPLGLWADAEHSPRGFATHDEVVGFVIGAGDSGAVGGYYCAIGELYRSPLIDRVPWWMSDYDVNDGTYHDPNRIAPRPPEDRPWAIHQFTSLGWPGGGSLDVNYAEAIAPPPPPRPKESDMYVVQNNDHPEKIVLHTALGTTDNIDAHYRDVLAYCGVQVVNLPDQQFNDTELIHYGQRRQFIDDVVTAIPADGEPPPVSDAAVLARTNEMLAAGTAHIDGGQVAV